MAASFVGFLLIGTVYFKSSERYTKDSKAIIYLIIHIIIEFKIFRGGTVNRFKSEGVMNYFTGKTVDI